MKGLLVVIVLVLVVIAVIAISNRRNKPKADSQPRSLRSGPDDDSGDKPYDNGVRK